MNPRERWLAGIIMGVVILAGCGFLVNTMFLKPLKDRKGKIDELAKSIGEKEDHIRTVLAQLPKLEAWRQLSLPADVSSSKLQYSNFLRDIMLDSGFEAGTFPITPKPTDAKNSPTIPGKGPIYTKLIFTVQAHGTLKNLVDMLARFYRASLLHQIKKLTVAKPATVGPDQRPGDLDIEFTVEALVLSNAENRKQLLPGLGARDGLFDFASAMQQAPAGLALMSWVLGPTGPLGPNVLAEPTRHYDLIAKKNIFFGNLPVPVAPEEPEVSQYVYLTDITRNDQLVEAFLYDRYNNRNTRLRAEPGFDIFRIQTKKSERRGKVIRIDDRDVFFRVDNDYYDFHVGQSLEEALKSPLKEDQMRSLGLVKAIGVAVKAP